MKSLKELFIIGPGPSSSHTIGPKKAAELFKQKYPNASSFKVTLFGSLALTGKGHLTDYIICKTLGENTKVEFNFTKIYIPHPNTMDFYAYDENGELLGQNRIFSLGGGAISVENEKFHEPKEVYPFNSFEEMNKHLEELGLEHYYELVYKYEDEDIEEYITHCLMTMFECVELGLNETGLIPGQLKLERVAREIYHSAIDENTPQEERRTLLISSFAYAVSENNASGFDVVTAPTCGSAGVIPASLYYEYKYNKKSIKELVHALMIAGLIGNIVKTMASISGAVGGCQAEIGTATMMAAAAISSLHGLKNYQIEYAAELALEHMLGLTCDPVLGYVQIPCIERNAGSALRACDAFLYAKIISSKRKNRISLDDVIRAMKITGDELSSDYKETSQGGLAKVYRKK